MAADTEPDELRFVPSIRRLALVSSALLAGLAAMMAVALVVSSAMLDDSVAAVARARKTESLARELELTVLAYQHTSNVHVLTGEEELLATRRVLEVRIRGLSWRLARRAASAEEHRTMKRAAASLARYLDDRRSLEASGADLPEIVQGTRPSMAATLLRVEEMRQAHLQRAREARVEAAWSRDVASVLGVAVAGTIVLALLAILWSVSYTLLRPLVALREAIARLRSGESEARARRGPVREVAEVTRGFNEMADTLERQRAAQLAFLAGVAHDLRNPLGAIRTGLHALEQERSDARRAHLRDRLDRQIDRLARMIEDLLDATRIESGALELRMEALDLREAVEDVVRLYAPTSPGHEIEAELPPAPVMVCGDPLRVGQVVSNLLSNAIKFSPDGGRVAVALRREGGEAIVSVSDQGIGMRAEDLAELFLPFRRRRPDVAPGAGLGLSVVRRIVTAHGGRIDVESETGRGSTFHVRLPLLAAEPAAACAGAPAAPRLATT